jgi:hypothetical protein
MSDIVDRSNSLKESWNTEIFQIEPSILKNRIFKKNSMSLQGSQPSSKTSWIRWSNRHFCKSVYVCVCVYIYMYIWGNLYICLSFYVSQDRDHVDLLKEDRECEEFFLESWWIKNSLCMEISFDITHNVDIVDSLLRKQVQNINIPFIYQFFIG